MKYRAENAADWSIDSGDYATAERKLNELLSTEKDVAKVHRQLAIILNNQGRRIEAAPHLLALAKLGKSREKELFAMITYGNPFIDTTILKPTRTAGMMPAMLAQFARTMAAVQAKSTPYFFQNA